MGTGSSPRAGTSWPLLAEEFNQLTDRLQTTEEVRRRFVSDASHELKTPLASIRLLADSILQNETMDQVTLRDFVSDIGTEADRLTRITEHLLALTRLDSLPAAETFPVDVSAVTRRALSMLAPVADAAGVALGSNLKDKCVVQGTEDDLYQICFNLLEERHQVQPARRPGDGGRVPGRGPGPSGGIGHGGWASRRRTCPRCSTGSTGWTRPAPGPPAAPGWGCPLSGTRCAATGDGSPSGPASRRAACSRWAFPLCRKNGRRETGDEAVDDCLLLGLLLLLGSCSTAAEKGGYQLYFASGLEDGSAILSEPYQGEADPGPPGIDGGSALRSHGGGAEQPLPQQGCPCGAGGWRRGCWS